MKLYLNNLYINNYLSLVNNDKLYVEKKNIKEIYTSEGIFVIDKNNIYKLSLLNSKTEFVNNYINNYGIYVDYTNIAKSKYSKYQIPFNHVLYEYIEYTIKISKLSPLSLVLKVKDNVVDWFFKTNESLDNVFIKDDINKLISYIK